MAEVVQRKADVVGGSGKIVLVSFECDKGCRSCAVKNSCISNGKKFISQALNTVDAKSGDKIELEIQKRSYYAALFALFVLPVIFMLAGYFIALAILDDFTFATIISLGSLILGFVFVKLYEKKAGKGSFMPKITGVVRKANL